MADDKVLTAILSKLDELNDKIDNVNSRLSQLEHSTQSSQAQMKINRDIQTMAQGQQLAMQYESSSIESELIGSLRALVFTYWRETPYFNASSIGKSSLPMSPARLLSSCWGF